MIYPKSDLAWHWLRMKLASPQCQPDPQQNVNVDCSGWQIAVMSAGNPSLFPVKHPQQPLFLETRRLANKEWNPPSPRIFSPVYSINWNVMAHNKRCVLNSSILPLMAGKSRRKTEARKSALKLARKRSRMASNSETHSTHGNGAFRTNGNITSADRNSGNDW